MVAWRFFIPSLTWGCLVATCSSMEIVDLLKKKKKKKSTILAPSSGEAYYI